MNDTPDDPTDEPADAPDTEETTDEGIAAPADEVTPDATDPIEAAPEAEIPQPPIEEAAVAGPAERSSAFLGVPIEVLISVGKARPLVSELVKLRRDSVISLDSRIDDPVEIYVGDRLIARGELQEMEEGEGQLGVRLTEVADLSHGV